MIDSTRLDSFITASQFCTGSQSDYSTCIANNLKFMEFLDDEYKASQAIGVGIQNRTLPVISGKSYTDLIPLAMAEVLTRIKTVNDYGVVDFRCSEVFNRPRLPLMRLQDTGVEATPVTDIQGLDLVHDDPNTYFNGIPIGDDLYLNIINLTIGFGTSVSTVKSSGSTINSIISGMLDYNELPDLSITMYEACETSLSIHARLVSEVNTYLNTLGNTPEEDYVRLSLTNSLSFSNYTEQIMAQVLTDIHDNVKVPLMVIDNDTDWTTFDYSITQSVFDSIKLMDNNFALSLQYNNVAKQLSAISGIPPETDFSAGNYQTTLKNTSLLAVSLYTISISEMLRIIKLFYQSSDISAQLSSLKNYEDVYVKLLSINSWLITLTKNDLEDQLYKDMLETLDELVNFSLYYSSGNLIDIITPLELKDRSVELDKFFTEMGDPSSILLSQTSTARATATQTQNDDRLSEYDLGGSFKDSGTFYYADLAYAIGFGKATDIHTIQIDEELYHLTDIVNDQGQSVSGISESGCTKYVFTRHVLPTYDVEVEMYIYPGTPDQPYCPTVNRYHNFASSKYSGMFSKLKTDGLMGLYTFKGYRPMKQTVEEVIEVGSLDINAINLNDPSIDSGSYEAMLQREVKNLTNASSLITDGTITTEDFKYYLTSELVDETVVNNYPGLMMVEFRHFPLGSSFKFPSIKLLITSEDPVGD